MGHKPWDLPWRRAEKVDVDQVVALLAGEFGWGQDTRDLCRRLLIGAVGADGYRPGFEFICDETVAANWRLKANPTAGRWSLRMAYYGMNPEREARADDITRRLVALSA